MTCPNCNAETIRAKFLRGSWSCPECSSYQVDMSKVVNEPDAETAHALMLNKAYYEERADDLRSGALDLKFTCPERFKPDLPRRFY